MSPKSKRRAGVILDTNSQIEVIDLSEGPEIGRGSCRLNLFSGWLASESRFQTRVALRTEWGGLDEE